MTIAEIKKLPVKSPVDSITGRVVYVSKRNTGIGKAGPWSVQNLILKQDVDEIHVACWGFDDLGGLKAREVTIAPLKTRLGEDKEKNARIELEASARNATIAERSGAAPQAAPVHEAAPATSLFDRLTELRLCYQHCLNEAAKLEIPGMATDAEFVRNVATSFFIEGNRQGWLKNPPQS